MGTTVKKIALLRGVTPTGKNRIPSMACLAGLLTDAGFSQVRTYIQSGNIILNTALEDGETAALIHRVIRDGIGADLAVIIKDVPQLMTSARENPFCGGWDLSRVHLVFTNDVIDEGKLKILLDADYGDEMLRRGSECLYMYLPRDAVKKRLNTNYLEKRLGITATMRKLSVVSHLCEE